jgi:hypothetical protein
MKCCALCGFVKLSHHNQHFKRKRNTYNDQISPLMGCTPYGIAYCVMAKILQMKMENICIFAQNVINKNTIYTKLHI